jgi:hypothetical protein
VGICERMMRIDAPADVVWEWLSDPRNLFRIDILHGAVDVRDTELRAGAVVTIDYDAFCLYRQRHRACIREVQPFRVSFAVERSPGGDGRDPFPHSQSFRVVPLERCSCILVNCVAGHLAFPGSSVAGERLFRRYMPAILDDHNQLVAVGCGALEPGKLRPPAGLVGVAVAASARLGRRSTRAELLEQVRTDRAMARRVAAPRALPGPGAGTAHRAAGATQRATPT